MRNAADADAKITLSYGVTVSAADFYAAVQDSGKGAYMNQVIAVGVSAADDDDDLPAPGGVGLVSQSETVTITK